MAKKSAVTNAGGKVKTRPAAKAAKKVAATKKGVKKAPAPKKAAKKATKKAAAPKKAAAKPTGKQAAKQGAKKGASAHESGLTVEAYLAGLDPWQKKLASALRALLRTVAPGSAESIKWGQPVFEVGGPFAYIQAHASSVNFGFWRGAELEDPHRLLHGDGGKMRHVKLTRGEALPGDPLIALIQQAVVLNLAKGDPTRKRG